MNIPFADLRRQYNSIKTEIDTSIKNVLEDFQFIGSFNNKHVSEFEKQFSSLIGCEYTIACANGTDALEIALEAIGIEEGDEVIVPALSWFSSSECLKSVNAKPIFVDVCETNLTIDVSEIERAITSKTKAIIVVHLYGFSCKMDDVKKIAEKYNLKIVEDCAQSHIAEFNQNVVGNIGDISTFSFYPGKNLGAYGDAGAICTNNEEYYNKCRMLSQHGQLGKHNHLIEGRNSRLDGIQASILNVKISYIKEWTSRRIEIADKYYNGINNNKVSLLKPFDGSKAVFHLFVILADNRDKLMEYLKENGIETAVHYPKALPFLKPYEQLKYQNNDFPIASKVTTNQILSIPMFPELTDEEVDYIIETINNY